jgi:SpoIID/LytB domain protein
MSQYGADAMAAIGYDYESILLHYYTGTHLGQYSPDSN